ncbi:TetR/AcrR family transcriptional regulator [Rhodovulum sulfidophilum]|uniref:TetR/AcrR family transcriptional regulator n=1 Tax=Rhodovulum sulfidophilum TaxID=35806 RepID=UPI001923595B|nr:helix-turn-helix domain-containing protein [Rhodovulum sulfidophilum]MBL3560382.1 helix-turn-helix transcriptional regulator [Rhodovulum sulfidophilum]
MTRPRGRPPRADAPVSRDEMLTAALTLLDGEGAEAFTMRALAKHLHVNPMTIHHHFGGRDGLIGAMSERVHARVSALLAKAGLSDRKRRLWLDILVDVTHGAALATAMAGRKAVDDPAGDQGYGAALDELLSRLGDEAAVRTESG